MCLGPEFWLRRGLEPFVEVLVKTHAGRLEEHSEVSVALRLVQVSLRVLSCAVNRLVVVLPLPILRVASHEDANEPGPLPSRNDLSGLVRHRA